jgi:hypothetical protein
MEHRGAIIRSFAEGFSAFVATLGSRARKGIQAVDNDADTPDTVALMKFFRPLIAIVAIGLAVYAASRISPPSSVLITHTVSLPEFGVQVVLASTWRLEPGPSGADFVAADPETGAVLAGAVTHTPATSNLEATIAQIIETQRVRWGTVENSSQGVMALGFRDARWVKVSFVQDGHALRMGVIGVQRGSKTLTLTCTGEESAQRACVAAIRPLPISS